MAKTTYPAMLERNGSGGLGISFPDLPGCVSATETDSIVEARASAEEALALHIQGMAEDGAPLPKASSIHAFGEDDVSEDFVAIIGISAEVPKTQPVENVRVNVILPQPLLERIDAAVERLGTNRSLFLGDAARQMLMDLAQRQRLQPNVNASTEAVQRMSAAVAGHIQASAAVNAQMDAVAAVNAQMEAVREHFEKAVNEAKAAAALALEGEGRRER